jgi:hypothetical protein
MQHDWPFRFCDRRRSGLDAQGIIDSGVDGLMDLCERRGEDDLSRPRARSAGLSGCRCSTAGPANRSVRVSSGAERP